MSTNFTSPFISAVLFTQHSICWTTFGPLGGGEQARVSCGEVPGPELLFQSSFSLLFEAKKNQQPTSQSALQSQARSSNHRLQSLISQHKHAQTNQCLHKCSSIHSLELICVSSPCLQIDSHESVIFLKLCNYCFIC